MLLGRVADEERLYRNIDDDEEGFRCPNDFVPVFSEEALASLDDDFRTEAVEVCGDDMSCLFDIAATGQVAIGQSTLSESIEITNEIEIAGI